MGSHCIAQATCWFLTTWQMTFLACSLWQLVTPSSSCSAFDTLSTLMTSVDMEIRGAMRIPEWILNRNLLVLSSLKAGSDSSCQKNLHVAARLLCSENDRCSKMITSTSAGRDHRLLLGMVRRRERGERTGEMTGEVDSMVAGRLSNVVHRREREGGGARERKKSGEEG